jgi:hypothetical protein
LFFFAQLRLKFGSAIEVFDNLVNYFLCVWVLMKKIVRRSRKEGGENSKREMR